jgi:outer membrane lipoprotein SlyB
MNKILATILLALPLAALVAPPAATAAPMSNDDVIKMVKGGLGEATVIQAINAAEAGFDTSPDGLVKLKQGGVNDAIIQRIIARKGAAPAAAAKPAAVDTPATAAVPPAVAKPAAASAPAAGASPPVCHECGTITGIREINKPGKATGLGAVAGGVVGGVLGRAIGGKDHRTAGTVAGAAGGAVAGHLIEKKARDGKVFEIGVRFDDGSTKAFTQDTHPSWNTGARVKLVNGALATL